MQELANTSYFYLLCLLQEEGGFRLFGTEHWMVSWVLMHAIWSIEKSLLPLHLKTSGNFKISLILKLKFPWEQMRKWKNYYKSFPLYYQNIPSQVRFPNQAKKNRLCEDNNVKNLYGILLPGKCSNFSSKSLFEVNLIPPCFFVETTVHGRRLIFLFWTDYC